MNELIGVTPFYITYRQDSYLKFKPQLKINIIRPIIKQIQLINIYNFVN